MAGHRTHRQANISVDGVDIEYLSDGKIVNEEGIIDMMSMMQQLTAEG